ncbi:lactose ABC transporter permease [Oceanobacillus iheyensis]|nr:lactose ABC transporter permease [Oceanobacillus iheyensis]
MYKTRHAWIFLAIPLLLLSVFTFLPSIAAFILSFSNYNVLRPIEWIGIENYVRAIQNNDFRNALGNTVTFWLLVTPALVIFPIFVAILVNQKLKGIKLFRLIFYFPVLVSVVITAILWKWMFAEEGMLNYFLGFLGVEATNWLTNPSTVLPALAFVTVWQGFGYYMLFYLASLQGVPEELYEASELDGATFFQKHFYVTIPLIKPMIFFVAVISTMGAFKEFTLMLTMTSGGPLESSTTVVLLVFQEAFTRLDMGYASALSFLLFIIILIITFINQKFLDKKTDN